MIIQGDILPWIQYLNYNARLRYPGIQNILLEIKRISWQRLPCHTYTYLPREGNSLADYLAGEGSVGEPPPYGESVSANIPLPNELRSKLLIYQAVQEQVLELHEKPTMDTMLLAAYWHRHPLHRAELCKYVAGFQSNDAQLIRTVAYWRTSTDGQGRFYAQGPATQKLPRNLRLLMFGRTHLEIDIVGAFYEIVRRKGSCLENQSADVLPPVMQMREILEQELSPQQPHTPTMPIVKRVMNAPVEAALRYITTQGFHPTPVVRAVSFQKSGKQHKMFALTFTMSRQLAEKGANYAIATSSTLKPSKPNTLCSLLKDSYVKYQDCQLSSYMTDCLLCLPPMPHYLHRSITRPWQMSIYKMMIHRSYISPSIGKAMLTLSMTYLPLQKRSSKHSELLFLVQNGLLAKRQVLLLPISCAPSNQKSPHFPHSRVSFSVQESASVMTNQVLHHPPGTALRPCLLGSKVLVGPTACLCLILYLT